MNYYKKIRWLQLPAILLALMPFLSTGQNINRVEYYIDEDPGLGNGSTQGIAFSPAKDITVSFTVNISDKGPGLHVIGVRSRDANGAWSFDERWLVLRTQALIPNTDIVHAES